jgi:pyochelin biosynthetic protein PchG
VVKVLVGGTNYGRIYIEALKLAGSKYSLTGILARGSPSSREIARSEQVPLYRSVRDLPSDVELACVAVGSSAVEVVFELLQRGVPVLCEHPVRTSDVRHALELARRAGITFNVNGHFADLETIAPFHQTSRQLTETHSVIAADLVVADRALYGGLDILRRSLDSTTPFQFRHIGRTGPFEHLNGKLGGTPITISIQTSGTHGDYFLEDCSPEYLTDFRITMIFQTGILTLLSIAGPVIWNRNCSRTAAGSSPMYDLLSPPGISSRDLYRKRVLANLHAIHRICEQVQTKAITPEQEPHYLIETAQLWETIGGLLKQ